MGRSTPHPCAGLNPVWKQYQHTRPPPWQPLGRVGMAGNYICLESLRLLLRVMLLLPQEEVSLLMQRTRQLRCCLQCSW